MPLWKHAPREIADSDILEADRIVGLLRSGFALATFAVLGNIGQSFLLNPSKAQVAQPYGLLQLGACLTVAALTYRGEFASYWREATLGLCLFLLWVATSSGVMLGEQVPTFITILVIMTATCALMPWEPKWQRALTWGLLAAALIDTFVIRPMSPYIGLLWLATLATSTLLQRWQHRCADLEESVKRRINNEKILAAVLGHTPGRSVNGTAARAGHLTERDDQGARAD